MIAKCAIGFGNPVSAQAVVFSEKISGNTSFLTSDLKGKIVVCLGQVGEEFLVKSSFLGLAGIVVPSIHYRDLEKIVRDSSSMFVGVVKRFGLVELSSEEKEKFSKFEGKTVKIEKKDNSYELEIVS